MITYTYFNEDRKRAAIEDLAMFQECARRAGIDHAMFVGFGLLLGLVREGDFIKHDNDIDICFRSDLIQPKQELEYYKQIKSVIGWPPARFRHSTRKTQEGFTLSSFLPGRANDLVRFTWMSFRKRTGRSKFCNWFWFPWNGYMWHTKAGKWVTPRKFDPHVINYEKGDDGIMLGIPQEYLDGFSEVKFRGLTLQVPKNTGSCLDFWYPGWLVPKQGGASNRKIICIVKNWLDTRTWRTMVK